jgi:hypothetical protein
MSDDRHLATRYRRAHCAELINRHTPKTPPSSTPMASAGELRGIPVIGRDTGGGAIPGTKPGNNIR